MKDEVCVYICMYSSVCVPWDVGHITRFPRLSYNEALLVYTSRLPLQRIIIC